MRRATSLSLLWSIVLLIFAAPSVVRAEEIGTDQIRAAVDKSMALIQSSPQGFFKKAGCVS